MECILRYSMPPPPTRTVQVVAEIAETSPDRNTGIETAPDANALGRKCALVKDAGTDSAPGRPDSYLTLARTGGATPPPLRFFADSEKTAELRAAGFPATLWGKPCAIFGNKKLTGSGQVTEL